MTESIKSGNVKIKGFLTRSAIVIYFIVALEIVIMISPFAFFFYAAFNPFLLFLNQSSVTRWLTAFFLPHMVVPPNEALTVIRILGSVFFVAGMMIFLVCAAQVYIGKLLKKGVATKGLYIIIRHPQYVGLGFAALGLAIMWPRFLTLTLFAIMLFLYYLLAKDEERRMTNRFGESYISYMNRTGMFFPRLIERASKVSSKSQQRLGFGKAILIFVMLLVIVIGSGFILRTYTVRHLALKQVNGVDVIAITKEDLIAAEQLLPSVLQAPAIASKLEPVEKSKGHRLLAYFIPINYVMQGMIADTGGEWKLFKQHKTLGMITEFILHPFGHLTGGHMGHAAMGAHDLSMHDSPAMKRRVIFIEVSEDHHEMTSPFDDFDINILRKPLFFADVHLHTGEILRIQDTPSGSGWGTVPTPMF
ncbi:MAG: methyltransferase family protein [Thermodesulfobacteriota bacterium]